jgi:hypothetical protein
MKFTVEELLAYANRRKADKWATLRRKIPFQYYLTESGIGYIPGSGKVINVSSKKLEVFCDEFRQLESFSPGDYPDYWHKSWAQSHFAAA